MLGGVVVQLLRHVLVGVPGEPSLRVAEDLRDNLDVDTALACSRTAPDRAIRTPLAYHRHVTTRPLLTALCVSAALAGCSGESASAPPQPATSTTSPAAAVAPATLAVTASDLGSGWQQRTIPGGDQVSGEVTLDLCGGGYASEGFRVARLQLALKNGPAVISNEVVKYRSGGAHLAYEEIKHRVAHCPSTPVTMPEAGAPKVLWHLTTLPASPTWTPTTVAVRATVTFRGKSRTTLGVYQFAGDWLSAVYTEDASKASAEALRLATKEAAQKLRSAADVSA